jgi:hypothetical protein
MKTNPRLNKSEENPPLQMPQIFCSDCGTSEHLIIESIESLVPKRDGWIAVEYSCGNCESFYAHEASVQDVAVFLAEGDESLGVLKFGRHYIHCGEPMEESGMKILGIGVDEDEVTGLHYVRIPSVVLRCRCGFQMAIPK